MGQLVTDDFIRPDAPTLGGNWTTDTGRLDPCIVSNQCKVNQGASDFNQAYYSGPGWSGGADQWAAVVPGHLEPLHDLGPCVRNSLGGNCYTLTVNDDDAAVSLGSPMSVGVYKQVGQAFTKLGASVAGVVVNSGSEVRVEVTANTDGSDTVVGKVGGIEVIRRTETEPALAAGAPGLFFSSGFDSIISLFSAGDFSEQTLSAEAGEPMTARSAF